MYCPSCLNNSLYISSRGVIHILVNGKQMDTSRFLYNFESGREDVMYKDLKQKLDDFFKWLSEFQNQPDVMYVQLCSADFVCENGCKLGANRKFSVFDVLIKREKLNPILKELGKKYAMQIEVEKDA